MILTHTYYGPAYRVLGDLTEGWPELVMGSFQVIDEDGKTYIDNGEGDRWLVPLFAESRLNDEREA